MALQKENKFVKLIIKDLKKNWKCYTSRVMAESKIFQPQHNLGWTSWAGHFCVLRGVLCIVGYLAESQASIH